MKLNNDKCHSFLSGYKHKVMWVNTGQSQIWESKEHKLLGIIIDWGMEYDEYILKQCKKAGRKLFAFVRICKFLNLERRKSLMKVFIESQFAYCLLVRMFCSRSSNNHIKVNKSVYIWRNQNCSMIKHLTNFGCTCQIIKRYVYMYMLNDGTINNTSSLYLWLRQF